MTSQHSLFEYSDFRPAWAKKLSKSRMLHLQIQYRKKIVICSSKNGQGTVEPVNVFHVRVVRQSRVSFDRTVENVYGVAPTKLASFSKLELAMCNLIHCLISD
jgi:hypothetical protein